MQYNIVFKIIPEERGEYLTLGEVSYMYSILSGAGAVPLTIHEPSTGDCAIGFINYTDAEYLNFDYSNLSNLVRDVLVSKIPVNADNRFEIINNFGVSTVHFIPKFPSGRY